MNKKKTKKSTYRKQYVQDTRARKRVEKNQIKHTIEKPTCKYAIRDSQFEKLNRMRGTYTGRHFAIVMKQNIYGIQVLLSITNYEYVLSHNLQPNYSLKHKGAQCIKPPTLRIAISMKQFGIACNGCLSKSKILPQTFH